MAGCRLAIRRMARRRCWASPVVLGFQGAKDFNKIRHRPPSLPGCPIGFRKPGNDVDGSVQILRGPCDRLQCGKEVLGGGDATESIGRAVLEKDTLQWSCPRNCCLHRINEGLGRSFGEKVKDIGEGEPQLVTRVCVCATE